jgi:hypothetical protein
VSGFPRSCLSVRIPYFTHWETQGPHKFLSLLSTHATPLDTDSPSEVSPMRLLCIGFRCVKNVADCIYSLNDADIASGMCVIPCGLCGSLCTLRRSSFVDVYSSRNHLYRSAGCATLDMGGWLDLTNSILEFSHQGLSP